jgi:hypothetical protein
VHAARGLGDAAGGGDIVDRDLAEPPPLTTLLGGIENRRFSCISPNSEILRRNPSHRQDWCFCCGGATSRRPTTSPSRSRCRRQPPSRPRPPRHPRSRPQPRRPRSAPYCHRLALQPRCPGSHWDCWRSASPHWRPLESARRRRPSELRQTQRVVPDPSLAVSRRDRTAGCGAGSGRPRSRVCLDPRCSRSRHDPRGCRPM